MAGSDALTTHVLVAGRDESVAGRAAASLGTVDTNIAVRTARTVEGAVRAATDRNGDVDCLVQTSRFDDAALPLIDAVAERRPGLPVILFVADADDETVREALGAGIADYLPRRDAAADCSVLVDRIHRAVRERAQQPGERRDDLVRDVADAVVRAERQEELTRLVCEAFASSPAYAFAWAGTHQRDEDRVDVRSRAGAGNTYAASDGVALDGDTAWHDALRRAVADREVGVVRDSPPTADWVGRDVRGAAFVPLTHRDTLYGVVGVHADRPAAFSEATVAALRDAGRVAGYGLCAAEQRLALIADHVVELEFEIRDRDIVLVDLSARADCTLALDGLLLETDGALRAFVDVDGAPAATVRDLAADDQRVVDVSVLAADGGRMQLTLRDPSLVEYFAEQGAVLDRVTATAGTGRAVLELPPNADARSVLGRVREEYSEIELIARRERQRERRPDRRFRGLLEERLTDRQHEALQVAYRSGFFEWPREKSGEEVAAVLGVAQPTFLQHLRTAERKLFAAFFDERRTIYSRES